MVCKDFVKYSYREGARYSVSAQIAGEVCKELETKGELTASNLVEISRKEDAPLHSCFDWDNNHAAEMYRQNQARQLIRSIVVIKEPTKESEPKEVVIVFNHLPSQEPKYLSIDTIRKDENLLNELKEECLKEMRCFTYKYKQIKEIQPVIEEMDKVLKDTEATA